MRLTGEHNEGEDFGTVFIGIERDDTATVEMDGTTGSVIRFSLYQHEAVELIEILKPIAESTPL